jgi:hypothetical protein
VLAAPLQCRPRPQQAGALTTFFSESLLTHKYKKNRQKFQAVKLLMSTTCDLAEFYVPPPEKGHTLLTNCCCCCCAGHQVHAGDQRPGHGGDVGGGEPPTQQRVQPQLCPTRALHVSHLHLLCTGAFLFVPYSVLLISNKFWNGGSRAVMLLNRTGGVVWALKSPSDPLRWQVGGGWAMEISRFLVPKWHSPIGSMQFHRICTHQKHYARGRINHRCINS